MLYTNNKLCSSIYTTKSKVRHRMANIHRRCTTKSTIIDETIRNISNIYDSKSKKNTTLIELTLRDYDRLKGNCIELKQIETSEHVNGIVYNTIDYGKHIAIKKRSVDIGGNTKYRFVDLMKTKGNYMLITADKNDCILYNQNTYVLPSNMTHNRKIEGILSGKVVLMIGIFYGNKKSSTDANIWDNKFHDIVKRCKKNSLDSYDHHGSKGFAYSFGNKPLYGNIEGSSVSVYVNKKSKIHSRQLAINESADAVEHTCNQVMNKGISALSNIIPEIKNLLNPIIDAAYHRQTSSELNLLQKTLSSENGCWNSILNVDGCTDMYHTESDCSYTFLTVPKQVVDKSLTVADKPVFLFKVTQNVQLLIPLCNDLSFVYNSHFLTHRQSYNPHEVSSDVRFYDITSYSNEKIFNHLRKSFNRLDNKDN